MKRIRIDNDFLLTWRIKRAGINEDLTNAIKMSLVASVKSDGLIHCVSVPFDIVDDSIVRAEITPAIAQWEGIYNFVLKYEFEYPSYVDNNEKVAVDKNAFIIVSRTAQADEITLIDVESDVLIGLKGEKGDAFTFDDFTPTQIEQLQQPAIDASVVALQSANEANTARDKANASALNADSKATLAVTATSNANTATSQANTARDNAITATTNANNRALYAKEQGDYAKAQGEVVAGYTLITSIAGTVEYNELTII